MTNIRKDTGPFIDRCRKYQREPKAEHLLRLAADFLEEAETILRHIAADEVPRKSEIDAFLARLQDPDK